MKHIKDDSPFTISAFICQVMFQQKYWLVKVSEARSTREITVSGSFLTQVVKVFKTEENI